MFCTIARRPSTPGSPTVKSPPRHRQFPRLQVISYNIGGFTAEGYDVFVDWLDNRCTADIVMIQETHWGLGREKKRWLLPGWIVISSPDADARCSCVAVFMRRRLFADQQVSHVTWISVRLLHVRHSAAKLHLDIIVGYQWVWQDKHAERTAKLRHHFWHQLSLLLQGLPTRNVLVMGADLNTQCRTVPGLIGRGLMPSSRRPDVELEEMLRERQLVLLNTWGRAAPSRCRTFENGSMASQLDFICTGGGTRIPWLVLLRLSPLTWYLGVKDPNTFLCRLVYLGSLVGNLPRSLEPNLLTLGVTLTWLLPETLLKRCASNINFRLR